MTERQKFLRLLSFVIEDLPTSAVDTAVRAGYPAPTSMLANVRIARVMNLEHLVALIGYGLLIASVLRNRAAVGTSV